MLAERGRYHVVDYAAADAKAALDLAFQVSANSWKGRSGSHMTGTAAREAFYRDITASFSEKGQVRIWIAFLDSRPDCGPIPSDLWKKAVLSGKRLRSGLRGVVARDSIAVQHPSATLCGTAGRCRSIWVGRPISTR